MKRDLLNNPSQGYKNPRFTYEMVKDNAEEILDEENGIFEEAGTFWALHDSVEGILRLGYRQKEYLDEIIEAHNIRKDCGKAICRSWLNPGEEMTCKILQHSVQFTGRRDVKWWGRGFWDAYLLRDQDTLIDFADYISQRMDIDPDYPKNPFQEAQLHYQMALFRGQPNRQALAQKVVDSYRREFVGDFQLEINYQRMILPAQCRLAIESGDEKAYNETLIQLIQAEVQNYLDDPEDSLFHNYQETINCLAAQAHDAGLKRNFESDLIFGEIERGEFSL